VKADVGLTVVKLGGSHATSPLLGGWLRALRPGVVVVPGGGPFADTVRAAQPSMGFSDAAAHDMALMGMAQYGRALADLGGWIYADDIDTLRDAVADRQVPVWSPWPMLRSHPDIAQNWAVTSDSLAAWLAIRLGAARLVLIKQRCAPAGDTPLAWARAGLVDGAFPDFIVGFHGEVTIKGPEDLPARVG
jgi:aspartokinase-like uncharacterized kinase